MTNVFGPLLCLDELGIYRASLQVGCFPKCGQTWLFFEDFWMEQLLEFWFISLALVR